MGRESVCKKKKLNFSRSCLLQRDPYIPSYLTLQMKQLQNDVKKGFQNDLFVSKFREDNFNSVWTDYVLENTENKALKETGGIIGQTLTGNALARWFLA